MIYQCLSKANEEFVAENYERALELYTNAIDADGSVDSYFVNRAHAYIRLHRYKEAVADSEKAIQLNPQNSLAFLRKGMALHELNSYGAAKDSLTQGLSIDPDNSNIKTWIQKCDDNMPLSDTTVENGPSTSPISLVPETQSTIKIRHDWYQTQTHVVLTILAKGVQKDDLSVDITHRTVNVTIKLTTSNDYLLDLHLSHEVIPDDCQTRIFPSKIELKLKKRDGHHWSSLEGEDNKHIKQISTSTTPATKTTIYPSSNLQPRDWDKIVYEIKEQEKNEEPEGEEALNKLFQKIYADGNDETRKAMNKSFSESGGTVLSTNWGDIGAKSTDVKPPDGMEFKKWDQ